MRTWKLFSVGGVAVRLHPTFLLLLVWVVAVRSLAGATPAGLVLELLFVVSVFACVVLHEFGHAVVARHFGVRTREITLLPIGGVARMERIPKNPRHELLIALGGPAVNVVLALLLALAVTPADFQVDPEALAFLPRLLLLNVVMAVFNLLPAFPMDGGRVLRAGLAMLMGHSRATAIAAGLGQVLALALALVGLLGNPFLVLVALFIWQGAAQEAELVEVHEALHGLPVARWMVTEVATVAPNQPLTAPLEHTLTSFQRDFPVVEGGRLVGLLTRADILHALLKKGAETRVSEAMRPALGIDAEQPLDQAFDQLLEANLPALPVVRGERVVGLLTAEKLAELVALRTALHGMEARR